VLPAEEAIPGGAGYGCDHKEESAHEQDRAVDVTREEQPDKCAAARG
jgi:hypothetical protein